MLKNYLKQLKKEVDIMNNNMYLLTDEVKLCKQDYDEREKLIKEFKEMPEEFF